MFAFWVAMVCGFLPFWLSLSLFGGFGQPTPMMILILISGHGELLCGHVSFARCHIVQLALASHCVSMCSMNSVVLHIGQVPLCSKFSMWFHMFPTISAWCVALYRNCWTQVLSIGFLKLFQMVTLVLHCPLKSKMVSHICCRRIGVVGGEISVFFCCIPL